MSVTITKRDLADRVADQHGLIQHQTLEVIQSFLHEMALELAKGNRLEFRDFGVFVTVPRKARTALNPKTLDKIDVPARCAVKFKAGRQLKALVRKLPAEFASGEGPSKDV